jgi:hypothetical protein
MPMGILLGVCLLAALVYMTLAESGVTCEACVSFGGRQLCETASAPDVEQARMQAVSSACSQLTSGVTSGLDCTRKPPVSLECSE